MSFERALKYAVEEMKGNKLYEFEKFCVNAVERLLLRQGEIVSITPKAFDLLILLLENNGHLLTKEELLQRLWPDRFVEEANLSHHIYILRKALGEDESGKRFIETIPRRGYRFAAQVIELQDEIVDLKITERTRTRAIIQEELIEDSQEILNNEAGSSHLLQPLFYQSRLKLIPPRSHNLPLPPTLLIGRESEIETIKRSLDQPHIRLLTLTGPGGAGKTHLSLQTAIELFQDYADGVFFVDLAPISDASLVETRIAQTLGINPCQETPLLETVKEFLRDKRMLLVLDNFEQVIVAARVVAELLSACPSIKILATSRESLRVRGEHLFPVEPLSLPDPDQLSNAEVLRQNAAVALFVQRALAVEPNLKLTDENLRAIASICVRLDGLPLAIELAAARVKIFQPAALLENIENRLRWLTDGPRDLPLRQQTMRAEIEWSYDLLDQHEQKLFTQLGVFVGGFTLMAAEAVNKGLLSKEDNGVLRALGSLINKSLLRRDYTTDDESRFKFLETIREYATERLNNSYERDEVRKKCATYFLSFVEESVSKLRSTEQPVWLKRITNDYENIRASLDWTEASGELETASRMTSALWPYWFRVGSFSEARERVSRLLEKTESSNASVGRARLLCVAGVIALSSEDSQQVAHKYFEESVSVALLVEDKATLALALDYLAVVTPDYRLACERIEESIRHFRQLKDDWGVAHAISNMAEIARGRGERGKARELYEEVLPLYESLGAMANVINVYLNLGHAAQGEKDYASASEYFAKSLALAIGQDNQFQIAESIAGLAILAESEGHHTVSARLFGKAVEMFGLVGACVDRIDRPEFERSLNAVRAKLKGKNFEKAWNEGRVETIEEILRYSLQTNAGKRKHKTFSNRQTC